MLKMFKKLFSGMYCDAYGADSPTGACDANYYCPVGQNTSSPIDYICTPGHYCLTGSANQIACNSGTYQDEFGKSSCKNCPEGYYCDGTIQNNTYCSHGVQNPSPCQPGYYCPAGTKMATEFGCPVGTFSDQYYLKTLEECTNCTGGNYCDRTALSAPKGQCNGGYYCLYRAQSPTPTDGITGDICPTGSYCPSGSNTSMPCPPGTYNPVTGLEFESQCLGCLPGQYCPNYGLVLPLSNCSAGYYCAGNATTSSPTDGVKGDKCPIAHYCPEGSPAPKQCEPGTFTDTELNEQCMECTPGYFCITGTNPETCPAGFYCPAGTGHIWQSCPAGTFSVSSGLSNVTQCTPCIGGYFCDQVNQTSVTGTCEPGYYCRFGADSATPSGSGSGDAGICPSGHYCAQQTQHPVPCPPGTFNNQTKITNVNECSLCLTGSYCDIAGLEYPTGLCDAGFYCAEGSNSSNPSQTSTTGGPCPVGTYCEVGSRNPTNCVAGSYNTLEQQFRCLDCPEGFYCEAAASSATECPKGSYCPLKTEYATQHMCPVGTFSNITRGVNISVCQLCLPGMYCSVPGLMEPEGNCAGGWYCILGSSSNKPSNAENMNIGGKCVAGNFCPEGSDSPLPCLVGHYCAGDGLANVTDKCDSGYYCSGSATIQNPVNETFGDVCPKGNYCPRGSTLPTPCGEGTYSNLYGNVNVTSCLPCTAGKYCSGVGRDLPNADCSEGWYCPEGMIQPQPTGKECLAGHSCPLGSPSQIPCPSGYYQPLSGKGTCLICSAGSYCDQNEAIAEEQSGIGAPSHGVITPKVCPAGFQCGNGTKTDRENPCPLGTYSNTTGLESVAQCRDCPPGYYCEAENITEPTAKCFPGYYCVLASTSPTPTLSASGGPCAQGTYCPEGSSQPTACPQGTYGDRPLLPSLADCSSCPPGEYCALSGLSAPNGSCLAGYYCSNSSEEANPVGQFYGDECPMGYYCPEQSYQPTACPAGTYQPFTRRINDSDCISCDSGKFCNITGGSQIAGSCTEGFYCISGASTPTPYDGITGNICPAGSYCPEASPQHYYCPNGTYTNHTGAAVCYDCPSGHYCVNRDRADSCLPGFFCPYMTGADLQPCPAGTYNPVYGMSNVNQCLSCDGGKYCLTSGLDSVSGDCQPGYYCTSGVDTATPSGGHVGVGGPCPVGHYCPLSTVEPLPCPAGSYSDSILQISCTPCPAGYFCIENSTNFDQQVCPSGYYCPAGTTEPHAYPCPKGSYNPANGSDSAVDCLTCTPGKYCGVDGLSEPSGNCSSGWYCTGGSYSDKPVSMENATSLPDCVCPLTNYTGGKCWPGNYCPSGSVYPISCTEGMYCMLFALEVPQGLCNPGYYCNGGASQPDPPSGVCPRGHYCEEGSKTPTPCPAGTMSDTEGNTNGTDCDICTPSYYCAGVANTNYTDQCSAGYFCPAGQQSPTPTNYNCTVGHYCPVGSGEPVICDPGYYQNEAGQNVCKTCSAGSYCDPVEVAVDTGNPDNGVVTPVDCPVGYYCPPQTGAKTTYPCPLGTFSNKTQLQTIDQCLPCSGAYYCDSLGLVEPTDVCNAGYVCTSGTNSSTPTDGITGFICQPGFYCPRGSDQGIKCPAGTFSNQLQLENVTECQQCLPGKYCDVDGLTSPTGNCTSGHYCTLGAIVQNPISQPYGDYCLAGHYCVEGTGSPEPCPLGTYLPDTGRTSVFDCLDCPGGKYCAQEGMTNYTGDCDAGYYCERGANSSSPNDGVTGDICPAGSHCPIGSSAPLPCEDGTYMNHTLSSECDPCPARYYCVNKDHPDSCPQGRYCPPVTGFNMSVCPRGTYNPTEMLMEESECLQCDGGYYCGTLGLNSVTGKCSPGYYCQSGVDTSSPSNNNTGFGGECPVGHYCPEGTTDPLGCEAGTYTDITHQAVCFPCPSGYYCLANSTSYSDTPCPKGAYCPEGTKTARQFSCPSGTYNNQTHGDNMFNCLPCPGGKYCDGDGLAEPTGDCASGWFCSGGAFTDKPSPVINTTVDSSFNITCPIYSLNNTGGICTPGTYCPTGSSQPSPCPLGEYCEIHALSTSSGYCYAGYFCNGSAIVPDPQPCSKGRYCPNGTAAEILCSPGTYSDREGNMNISNCIPCDAGSYCQEYGLSTPSGPCDAGYYCPEGQDTPRPVSYACSPGHFCLTGSWNETGCPSGTFQPHWKKNDCDICPAGLYCKAFGDYEYLDDTNITLSGNFSGRYRSYRGVSVPTICPQGSYCPDETKHEKEYLCSPGSYGNKTGLSSDAQCTPCDPGYYCSGEGNTETSGLCASGYFCNLGAYNSTPTDGITGDVCPMGRYCTVGSVSGQGCPVGTYSNLNGLQSDVDCQKCTPGYYCGRTGLVSESGTCWAGYYCILGSTEPSPINQVYGDICTAGHFCPNGTSSPNPCPPGTYLDQTGLGDENDCINCSPGSYCDSWGKTNVTGLCSAGFYCTSKANNSAPTDSLTGDICPIGHYCEEGTPSPTPCQNATYMNHTGASSCYICPEGHFCVSRDTADICRQGYYCPEGTGADLQPCPIGTFGNTTGLFQESQCTLCRGGEYCGTPGSPDTDGQCQSGYYCVYGVDTATPPNGTPNRGGECPSGSYCPVGTTLPIPCAAGTYTTTSRKGSCDTCLGGYYCLLNTSDPTLSPCPAGHYCPPGTQYAVQSKCTEGTYNPDTTQSSATSCLMCPAGQYCSGLGNSQPSGNCSAGWFCSGSATESQPIINGNFSSGDMCTCPAYDVTGGRCASGTYCPSGSAAPINCDAGSYCDDFELPSPKGLCQAGYFCPSGQKVADPIEFRCVSGHYCPEGSATPTACPIGTFSNSTGNTNITDCKACTPGYYCDGLGLVEVSNPCNSGYYCPEGQITSTPVTYICSKGFYCPPGSPQPIMCARGTYQFSFGQSSCESCPSRFYCDPFELGNITGIIDPVQCPVGHFCPLSTGYKDQNPCPPGTFSNTPGLESNVECEECSFGYYCAQSGLTASENKCAARYFCQGGASSPTPTDGTTGNICPVGFYCEEGSAFGTQCPLGTYNNFTGLRYANECIPCDPGYYCPSQGLIAPYEQCTSGYYCEIGSPEPAPVGQVYGYLCPVGHYCPQGIPSPVACNKGTYQPAEGKKTSTACINCDPGYYCLEEGNSTVTGRCMEGFYCSSKAQLPNPTDGVTGDICPVGNYCPLGSDRPLTCPPSTYMNHTGASVCDPCPEGFFCTKSAEATPCPQGFYCPSGTGSNYSPCPIGTFGANDKLTNESECSQCVGGSYCNTPGLLKPTGPCDEGYYCVSGVNVATPNSGISHTGIGERCQAGFECPVNSTYPIPCSPGQYAPADTISSCYICPEGYYCENETITPVICPTGHYCPPGTEFNQQYTCPHGTFNNDTGGGNETEDCLDCPPGYYCQGQGNTNPSGLCDAGFFCAGKSYQQRPYDPGFLTYMNGTTSDLYSNDTCTPTWDCVCPQYHLTRGGICPIGYYCPQGSTKPQACNGGQYCALPGLEKPTGNCSMGWYCNGTSAIPNQFECPEGHYCIEGTTIPEPCPSGTFSNTTHSAQLADCHNCTAGKFCHGLGNIVPTDYCDAGYYCPGGQSSATPSEHLCLPGHYCERGSAMSIVCPNGTYQYNSGQSYCDDCPASFFCDPNDGNITLVNGIPVASPSPCPSGFYCPSRTVAAQSNPCPPGTYGPDLYYSHIDNCTSCPSGSYCERSGLSQATGECWSGYYCTGGASLPTPIDDMVDHSNNITFTGNDLCPVGYYCTNGTSYPLPCPIGTFSTQRQVSKPDDCEPCPRGRYCNIAAFTKVSEAPLCDPGYICISGSTTATPSDGIEGYLCPPGHFCIGGAEFEEGCPIGTYQSNYGSDNCTTCPAGLMCPDMNMTSPLPCKTGFYCPYSMFPQPCPSGTYNNKTNMDDIKQCTDCSPGKYCEGPGNIIPTGECDGGYFCEGGATSAAPSPTSSYPNNGLCIEGHYCPVGTSRMIQCPAGTIRNSTGGATLEDCLPCPGGYYCAADGQIKATGLCSAGYYCPANDTTISPTPSGLECPVGYYCIEGTADPIPCPAGQFQINTGQSSCEACPAGFYCQSAISPELKDCPAYHYCPEGTAYPLTCENGTFTYDNQTNFRASSDCLPCVSGEFCRNGQRSGNCAAGFYCKSGSREDMPNKTLDFDMCESNTDCSGLCPRGYFCLIGTILPTPCPHDTYRDTVGAEQQSDCANCPAGSLCPEGTADPQPCPAGFYCLAGNGTTPCPRLTYRNDTGGAVITDCYPCVAGYLCNYTGMAAYENNLCPPGFFCLSGQEAELCPAGTMRDTPGSTGPIDCPLCRPGYYCPNDTDNTQGIPCQETFECPIGASMEIDCRPGHFCKGTTGFPPICPGGYYCRNATDTPIECHYPEYCPEGSNMTLICPLGYMANYHSGVRDRITKSCRVCPAGTFGNYTDRSKCDLCPSGYYCPVGTGHGDSYPCPIGSYCPMGSASPIKCPIGMYGKIFRADNFGQCTPCLENYYNNLEGQKACRPCGSSSSSVVGSSQCTCYGNFRNFQESDGSCVCMTGYIFYNEIDQKVSTGNGDEDCQQIVDVRCSQYETRIATDRTCSLPENYDCTSACIDAGGALDIDLGRCKCNLYREADEVCDQICRDTTMPSVGLQLLPNGAVSISIRDPTTGTTITQTITDIYGPSEQTTEMKTVFVCNFYDDRVTASLYKDSADALDLFTPLQDLTSGTPARRRLLATTVPANQMPNPALCLNVNDLILFKVWLNNTDRSQSHYPVYQKDHLYNTNPSFDYGPFTQLENLLVNTNVTITSFAYVFTEGGNYVFIDSQSPDRDVIIAVKPVGSTCTAGVSQIVPSSPTNLIALGVTKTSVQNEEPDWGLIIGLIAFFAAIVILLVVAVIVWKPRDSIIYPMKHWKPKYRSLGAPPPVPSYIRFDTDHWPDKHSHKELGPRTVGDGAEVVSKLAWHKESELEGFNVRMLYDKLEDQNLHLASQLSRQKEDLQGFYSRICEQNEQLKKLLNDIDPKKLAEMEENLKKQKDGKVVEKFQGKSNSGPNVINANVKYAAVHQHKFVLGGNGRELELLSALQILLDRLNTGNVPLSQDLWDQIKNQTSGHKYTLRTATGSQAQGQGELLRNHNTERMNLEKELEKDEREAYDVLLDDIENKHKTTIDDMSNDLKMKLQGDLTDDEVKQILSIHEKHMTDNIDKLQSEKDRQLEELRRKLAERRRNKENLLKDKQSSEAEKVGLPPPVRGYDDTDYKLKHDEQILNATYTEEMSSMTLAETDLDHDLAEKQRIQLSEDLNNKFEALSDQELINHAKMEELVKNQKVQEETLAKKVKKRHEQHLAKLKHNLEERKRKRIMALRNKQEKEKAELSVKMLENSDEEYIDRLLAALEQQHQADEEALMAEVNLEETEQIKQVTEAFDDEHTSNLKTIHRNLLKEISENTPAESQLAVERLLVSFRQDEDSLHQELQLDHDRQIADLQAKLAARRSRKLANEQRKQEEAAVKQFVQDQTRQMKQGVDTSATIINVNLQHVPKVQYSETTEEKAVKKEQERIKDDLKKRHKADRDTLATKLDNDTMNNESQTRKELELQKEKLLHEQTNKQAAELAARTDLTQDEINVLMAAHSQELENLADKLDAQQSRQQLALRERLAERRKLKMSQLRRRQEAELTKEMLEQQKELDDVKLKQAHEVEKKAIEEGIRENGQEESDKVIQAVLAKRHAQELKDLENRFNAEKRVMVDEALNNLQDKYDKKKEDLLKSHQDELNDLKKRGLSPEDYQEEQARLLNKQQMELSKLDKQLNQEERQIKQGALADWEVAFAREKLNLKEKHYKEFADALREYSPKHDSVKQAEIMAEELEEVKQKLKHQRQEEEKKLKAEQQEFEKLEKERLEADMKSYAQQLEEETNLEKSRREEDIKSRNKHNDELVKDKKDNMKKELEKLKADGGTKEEQERLLKQHEQDIQTLVNKLEADRLRMDSKLQERLKKRREEKMKLKEKEVKENLEEQKRELESHQQSAREKLKTDEVLALQETLNVGKLPARQDPVGRPATPENVPSSSAPGAETTTTMPTVYSNVAPLNEAEMISLLMASPMYKKLEEMKKSVANGGFKPASKTLSENYTDERETQWESDKVLKPVDLNKVDAKTFVVYKFGCFISNLISLHCSHSPVTLLLADEIPPNKQLTRNMYRNSFSYDGNNHILYIRTARLETVGEFISVLLHTMSHIKSGDLTDDSDPNFSKEYQRAISSVCNDLFFARYQQTSNTAQALAKTSNKGDVDAANKLIQSIFGQKENELLKAEMVDDLLDVKVHTGTDVKGAKFNKDKLVDRLSKYSNYTKNNQLHRDLGNLEDKMKQSGAQGSNYSVDNQISKLTQKYTTTGLSSVPKAKSSFVMANMTGQALWNSYINQQKKEEQTTTSLSSEKELEEKHDELLGDFAEISRQILTTADFIKKLEEEITSEIELTDKSKGKEKQNHSKLHQMAVKKLADSKQELTKLEIEKSKLSDKFKDLALIPNTPAEFESLPVVAKGNKSKK